MYHRAIHGIDGELSALPYGREGDAIWSVSRSGINQQLLNIADSEAGIETHFEHWLLDVDFETARTVFQVQRDYLSFLLSGGSDQERTCLNLLIDDKVVASATGRKRALAQWNGLE